MLFPTAGTELSREIQKEVCWTLSNIAAGSTQQVQQLIDCGIMSSLIEAAKSSMIVHDVKVEACWAVLNATSCGTSQQIQFLVQHGYVVLSCVSFVINISVIIGVLRYLLICSLIFRWAPWLLKA